MGASKGTDAAGDADPREPAADAAPHEATA
jgi:hypothetical protein